MGSINIQVQNSILSSIIPVLKAAGYSIKIYSEYALQYSDEYEVLTASLSRSSINERASTINALLTKEKIDCVLQYEASHQLALFDVMLYRLKNVPVILRQYLISKTDSVVNTAALYQRLQDAGYTGPSEGDDYKKFLSNVRSARRWQLAQDNKDKPPKYTEREKQLRKYHAVKPNVITNDKLIDQLYDEDIRGKAYQTDSKWIGYTPQTLNDEDYDEMVNNFSEMVGVAHMRPEFDRRLLTAESAQQVYGPGYDYEMLDMDNDPNTPGTLRITRQSYRDAAGNTIPRRVVAIGGYKIPNATTGQSERLLKNMMYYSKYPTTAARRETSYSDYLAETQPFISIALAKQAKREKNPIGFDLVTKKVKEYLDSVRFTAPNAGESRYAAVVHNARTADGQAVHNIIQYYRFTIVSYNTLVSRLAQLLAYAVVFPKAKKYLTANTSNTVNAFLDLVETPTGTANKIAWNTLKDLFIHPELERKILRDSNVQEAIEKSIKDLVATDYIVIMRRLINFVIFYMMNCNLGAIVSYLTGRSISAPANVTRNTEVVNFILNNGVRVSLMDAANTSTIENQINLGQAACHVITPIKQDILVEERDIQYIAKEPYYVRSTAPPQ